MIQCVYNMTDHCMNVSALMIMFMKMLILMTVDLRRTAAEELQHIMLLGSKYQKQQ